MAAIEIDIKEYGKAKNGSLLIKENGKWIPITYDDLNASNNKKFKELDNLKITVGAMKRSMKHFTKYAKSHFIVAFDHFKMKVLTGEIEIPEEDILTLDEKVLNNEITVEEALKKDKRINDIFKKLFLNDADTIEFPEV